MNDKIEKELDMKFTNKEKKLLIEIIKYKIASSGIWFITQRRKLPCFRTLTGSIESDKEYFDKMEREHMEDMDNLNSLLKKLESE